MNILFSKITKRKKIEFDDPKSSASTVKGFVVGSK